VHAGLQVSVCSGSLNTICATLVNRQTDRQTAFGQYEQVSKPS